MADILQKTIPHDVTRPRPLPGMAPLAMEDWLRVDEAFAGQMAERERLIAGQRADVLAVRPEGADAADELLDYVLNWLRVHSAGYQMGTATLRRPDGREVPIDRADPMGTLGQVVQEDFCILQKCGDEHVLTAAILCFPASWRLCEKIGKPLIGIHDPVPGYDAGIARRVQRLFDGVQVDQPLWRFNVLSYADPVLHQPRSVTQPRPLKGSEGFGFVRSERQTVLRLPQSGACVFSIHTYVARRADVLRG